MIFNLNHDVTRGLTLTWSTDNGLTFTDLPLRVRLRGDHTFCVWGNVDSGEGPPAWADAEFVLELFGGSDTCRLEAFSEDGRVVGFRATARHPRVEVLLEVRVGAEITSPSLQVFSPPAFVAPTKEYSRYAFVDASRQTTKIFSKEGEVISAPTPGEQDDELAVSLQLRNPQHAGGQRLPLCLVELDISGFCLGAAAEFVSAHSYGGRTHGVGRLADLLEPGMPFAHGCIGLALPLLVLHDPDTQRGLQVEFMMDGRPTLWLRPGVEKPAASCVVNWLPDRLLQPGQVHAFGGALKFKPVNGSPDQSIRNWRDTAAARYGIRPPAVADWVKQRSCIELHLMPGAYQEFTRLDDPALYAMLKRWRDWGYNAIMAVSPNPVVTNFLSPLHYHASEAVGGAAAEKVMLGWMHELGFHVGIWFTTVGLDKTAPEVRDHQDWWTHRPNQELFYAWDSNPNNNFVGYAPDADPGSTGWRRFMLEQLDSLLERGWNGVFIDGCIPRSSNHARWFWPGESRNAVEDQVAELAEAIRRSGKDAILCDEDSGLAAQAVAEITTGRYTPMAPFFKKAYWDHGMGGGPKELGEPPSRIPPERAREYLLIRYASLLPGAISEDGVEGYASEEARPWTVVSMLAGPTTFKTHAEYVNDPLTFRQLGDAPPAGALARDPAHRQRGHEEFLRLLRLRADEPLIGADTPLSISGVQIEDDDAVVGLLRPTADRCLLILINFAARPATVRVRLVEPTDIPSVQRPLAGVPHTVTWQAHELQHSIADSELQNASFIVSAEAGISLTFGAYGFRILELNRCQE